MRIFHSLFLISLMLLFANGAHGQAELTSSEPQDGETVVEAPEEITLAFSEAVLITTFFIEDADGNHHPHGALPAEAHDRVTVELPPLGSGDYEVHWRVIGEDGDLVEGAMRFVVDLTP